MNEVPATHTAGSASADQPARHRRALRGLHAGRFRALTLLDSVDFAHDRLLPRLTVSRWAPRGQPVGDRRRPEEVFLPPATSCRGLTDDSGFLHPELTDSATAPMADELAERERTAYLLSSNRTCEIGMRRGTSAMATATSPSGETGQTHEPPSGNPPRTGAKHL